MRQSKKVNAPAPVLAYDLGGTKVAVGLVSAKGKVLDEVRVPVVIEQGKDAVIRQLADLGLALMKQHRAKFGAVRRAGIASAGPLDPRKGLLLDPTNFGHAGGTWGKVALAKLVAKRLKIPVILENDAAAAMLAEHWIGAAKGYDNAMILTLGTGLGTGIIVNGELQRAGRYMHPEGGHVIIHQGDQTAPCGCGNFGCAEAYLAGRSFGKRSAARLGDPSLTALDVAELARRGDTRARRLFEEYAVHMATAIHNYTVLYCPEIVVLTGSFAHAADLFLDSARAHLERFLSRRRAGVDLLPKLAVSTLNNRAGLIGGAFVALNSGTRR